MTTRMKFEIGFGADFALLKAPADRLADGTRALLNLMINIIRRAMSSGALKTIAFKTPRKSDFLRRSSKSHEKIHKLCTTQEVFSVN